MPPPGSGAHFPAIQWNRAGRKHRVLERHGSAVRHPWGKVLGELLQGKGSSSICVKYLQMSTKSTLSGARQESSAIRSRTHCGTVTNANEGSSQGQSHRCQNLHGAPAAPSPAA